MAIVKRPKVSLRSDMRGADLSGTDLDGLKARDYNFFEAIFNGCRIERWRVAESVFQHAEFSETSFRDCTFEESSFDHSDFVSSTIENCSFIRCTFQNAEWRDAIFIGVKFRQCVFRNTTSSLARFVDCDFDRSSSSSFVSPSKRFNLFSDTKFHLEAENIDFLRTSFGIVGDEPVSSHAIDDPLFSLSVERYNRDLRPATAVRKVLAALEPLIAAQPLPSPFRLRYALAIARQLIDERELSLLAVKYFHDQMQVLLNAVRDSSVLLEVLGFIATLRISIAEQLAAIDRLMSNVDPEGTVTRCELTFALDFPRHSLDDFVDTLAVFSNIENHNLSLRTYYIASTFAEIVLAATAPILTFLRFLHAALANAEVIVKDVKKLKQDSTGNDLAGTALVPSRRPAVVQPRRKSPATRQRSKASTKLSVDPAVALRSEPVGADDIQVVVRVAREKVLAVGGPVRVVVLLQ